MSDTPTHTEASLRHGEHVMVSLSNHESMTSSVVPRQARDDVAIETTVLQRIATPLLLFAAAFFLLLLAAWFFLLPRFTQFAVAGNSLSPSQMAAYVQSRRSVLASLESKRDQLVEPQTDPSFTALATYKSTLPDPLAIRTALINAAGMMTSSGASIAIQALDIDASTDVVSVTGDVKTKDPSSMTVLAAYVDALEKLSFITHLERPAFTRSQDAAGMFHSPFAMKFVYSQPQ